MHDPKLWDDPTSAQTLLVEEARLTKRIEQWRQIETRYDETALMIQMSAEESGWDHDILQNVGWIETSLRQLYLQLHLNADKDECHAIVTIHPGAGGTESADWAEMLTRMYVRWAERRGYAVETLDRQAGEEAGIKSVTFRVTGQYAYGYMKSESGVHRLVRISPFDANKRRHTSFASVFISPEIADDPDVEIDEKDIRIDTYRASSAGGQNVNKVSSAIRITHFPTGVVVQCQNERSQLQNKATALTILRSRIYKIQQEQRQQELSKISGAKKEIAWGSQIRSYVFQPYQMVKDHRTGTEIGNVSAVMDGEIDALIEGYLAWRSSET